MSAVTEYKRRRFQAACAAMQGLITQNPGGLGAEQHARIAVSYANALLKKLGMEEPIQKDHHESSSDDAG